MTTDPKGLAEQIERYRSGDDEAVYSSKHVANILEHWKDRLSVQPHAGAVAIKAALNARDLFINPHLLDKAADEIDCCPSCEYARPSGYCPKSDRGDYCPNDVAETLRAVAKVALYATPPAAQPQVSGLREALRTAIAHIEHMVAWITAINQDEARGRYSFESLGEDMPGMKAAIQPQPNGKE